MSLLDFMSLLEPDDIVPEVLPAPDFMSVEDEPAPVPDVLLLPVCGLAAGDDDVPDDFVSVLGLAAGAFVSAPWVAAPGVAGVLVSALEPLPPVLAPALDDEPLAAPLAPLAPPLWANADVASMEAGGSYDQTDAEGFLRIQGLPSRVLGKVRPRTY